jgi:ribonuclease HI
MIKQVTLYSDGACSGNPGPGGFGSILVYGPHRQELAKGYKHTTNNRMELLGVIEPMEILTEPCKVHAITDSQYVANAVNKGWIQNWVKKGWKTAARKPVKNQDLWNRLIKMMDKHSLTIEWVRGHDGHAENERCDKIAVAARESTDLVEDSGYDA